MTTSPPDTLVTDARELSEACAAKTGVRIRPLDTLEAVREAAALFAQVWRSKPSQPPLAADVMRATNHAGGYVVGAYANGRLVGASLGFLGMTPTPTLHSHISGVASPGGGIGLALKLHQRTWALERGIETVTWTFDPLVRRNAWFNLRKLGAVGVEYLADFYGPMDDGLNAGVESDRLFARWSLLSLQPPPAADTNGAVLLLDERDGFPWPATLPPHDGRPLLIRLPEDIITLRKNQPAAAHAWRMSVRDTLAPAFSHGYLARDMTPDGFLVLGR